MRLRVDLAVSSLFGNLGGWDFEELKKDISEYGVRVPLTIDGSDGTVVDGHQRYRAWVELGRNPEDPLPFPPHTPPHLA